MNRIKIPLLILEYATVNFTNATNELKSSEGLIHVDFTFEITFIKRPNLNFFFQVVLPALTTLSILYSLLQTFFYKLRQQKTEYDFAVLLNFLINLLANISNALIAQIMIFCCYVFFVYKTQSHLVKMMLPLKEDEKRIGILLVLALSFKV